MKLTVQAFPAGRTAAEEDPCLEPPLLEQIPLRRRPSPITRSIPIGRLPAPTGKHLKKDCRQPAPRCLWGFLRIPGPYLVVAWANPVGMAVAAAMQKLSGPRSGSLDGDSYTAENPGRRSVGLSFCRAGSSCRGR